MAVKPLSLRRKLLITILVLMTSLPLVVYFYLRRRATALDVERFSQLVAQRVSRVSQLRDHIETIIGSAAGAPAAEPAAHKDPGSPEVREQMETLGVADEAIAYIELADRQGKILNSTSNAPDRQQVASPEQLLFAAPEAGADAAARRFAAGDPAGIHEFAVDLRLPDKARGHVLVGLSPRVLYEQLEEFQNPARLSALQISVLCVSILAVFSAYIFYLHERARALHAQLQEESRMAYIGTLASSIAHEVRNPLSSVKMNAQMLERRIEKLSDPAEADYFRTKVARISSEVDRLEGSVSHFLAFGRPAPLQLGKAALNQAVGEMLDFLEPQCQSRGLRVVRKFARDLPPTRLDPRQFAQAVQNLVLNAAQALERGGIITVATEARGDAVTLTVADNGPGIPPEIQDKIFDVFFTTREGGTGLGLNIVHRIAEEHHGKLSMESQPGQGTRFLISLPAARERPASPEEA